MKLRNASSLRLQNHTSAQLGPDITSRRARSMKIRPALFMSVALLALAGCSVVPKPLTLDDNAKRMNEDMSNLFAGQEALNGPITLEQAVARAIKYNLDHRLKVMENALASRQLTTANLSMLPDLTARVGYTGRNNHAGSNSASLTTGAQSLESSTSSDRDLKTADLTLTWNVLDLGMSYVRAQQQADRLLITKERRRKVLQNVIQSVRTAYWNALSAERLLVKIAPLSEKVNKALSNARLAQQAGAEEPLSALRYRRELLDMLRQLKVLTRELNTARFRLAALMNLRPGSEFTLDGTSTAETLPVFDLNMNRLERMALVHRPELREETYQDRISHNDVKLAYIGMVPGLELNTAYNSTSNSYAWEQSWFSWGSSITANLFKVFTGPQNVKVSKARTDVVKVRRMALSMAVMSQVHVSVAGYNQAIGEYKTANELNQVENEILAKTKANVQAGDGGSRAEIRAELQSLISELRRDIAYAEVRNSVGLLYVSIGADPLPKKVQAHDLTTISTAFKTVNDQWFSGTYVMPEPSNVPVEKVAKKRSKNWFKSLFN